MSETEQNNRGKFKVIKGRVVSDKMQKTIIITINMMKMHPLLKKIIRRSKRIMVHDEREESKVGDLISVIETRPLSKLKRHRLFKILEKSV